MENNQEEYEALKEKYLSLMAEFDNYKKRVADISKTEYKRGMDETVLKLLPVLDNIERAMTYESDSNTLAKGVANIRRLFEKTLNEMGYEVMDVLGHKFNGDFCECVHQVEVPEEYKGKVFEIILNGYSNREKIIRYPKVVVGK